MSRKIFFFLVLGWLLWGKSQILAKVKEIEIYRNGVFFLEEFEVKEPESKFLLLAPVKEEDLEFLNPSKGLEILSLEITKADAQTELHQRLKALLAQEEKLSSKIKKLEKELEILEKALKENPLSAAELQKSLTLFDNLWQEKEKSKEELKALQKTLKGLREKVAFEEITVLKLMTRGRGKLHVRYPATKLISYRESYALYLNTQAPELKIKAAALLRQRSGKTLGPLELRFYPRSRSGMIISPPPFNPWFVENHFLRPKLLLKKAETFVRQAKPRLAQREVAPGAIWERITLEGVVLSPGRPQYLPLAEENLPLHSFLIEVPLYATTQPFFRADVRPERSFPRLQAKLYLDHSFVGESWCGPFDPGKEVKIYFGPASLLEVKQEVLKDLSGSSFWGKKIQEKETRTKIINHYQQKMLVEVVERIPVPRKKEIKIEVKSNPPWTEKTPEGKVLWRFELAPEEKKTIWFYLKIQRPKDE